MAGNVQSWQQAIKAGHEPMLYYYTAWAAPAGELLAVLDFKIWAKKVMAINCYFTEVQTERRFQLTVYCRYGRYRINDIDFTSCPVGRVYRIRAGIDTKGRLKFTGAFLMCAFILFF